LTNKILFTTIGSSVTGGGGNGDSLVDVGSEVISSATTVSSR